MMRQKMQDIFAGKLEAPGDGCGEDNWRVEGEKKSGSGEIGEEADKAGAGSWELGSLTRGSNVRKWDATRWLRHTALRVAFNRRAACL